MRVTPQMISQQTIANLRRNQAKLAEFQDQVASGKRLQRSSDNPVDAAIVARSKTEEKQLDRYINNIDSADSLLNVSVNFLKEAHGILSDATSLTLEANNGLLDDGAFGTMAKEIDAMLERMLHVANADFQGESLFAGTDAGVTPFTVAAQNGQGLPARVVYDGSQEDADTLVGRRQNAVTLLSGEKVFQSRERTTTTFIGGGTGVAAGSGTDSGTGQGSLRVTHVATTFSAGSGVANGTSSVAGDTILGPMGAHSISIDDVAKTISLNGGAPVVYTGTETDLRVTSASGDVVFLDTTGIVVGFIGVVNLQGDGALSTDGGATSTPIAFSGNQVLIDSTTGATTNVDSTNIRRAGVEVIDYGGTHDVFETLIAIRDTLRNSSNLSDPDRQALLGKRMNDLERLRGGVLEAVGQQASTAETLVSVRERTLDLKTEIELFISSKEDVDIVSVITGLQLQTTQFEQSLAVAARINQMSILDFLR